MPTRAASRSPCPLCPYTRLVALLTTRMRVHSDDEKYLLDRSCATKRNSLFEFENFHSKKSIRRKNSFHDINIPRLKLVLLRNGYRVYRWEVLPKIFDRLSRWIEWPNRYRRGGAGSREVGRETRRRTSEDRSGLSDVGAFFLPTMILSYPCHRSSSPPFKDFGWRVQRTLKAGTLSLDAYVWGSLSPQRRAYRRNQEARTRRWISKKGRAIFERSC